MNKVEIPVWPDSENISKETNRVSCQLKKQIGKIKQKEFYQEDFENIIENIKDILKIWTGETYIGKRKEKKVEKHFQLFFESLYDFISTCKKSDFTLLQEFADESLYQGRIYRYIGILKDVKEPEYNNIYVSWSKNLQNTYIESKLSSDYVMIITCDICDSYYGIDIEAFDESRGEEREVVFPTIKELIIDKKIIKRD